ncbi:MAG TPA: CpaF family protein [Ktedonobacterales bacterium]|nr:CpaF family protein [Ktedonobacterales bacterium]
MSLLRRFEESSQGGNGQGGDNMRGPLTGRMNGGGNSFSGSPDGISSPGGGGRFNSSEAAPPRGPLASPGALGGSAGARENGFFELKRKVQNALIAELDPKLDLTQTAQVRRNIEEQFNRILDQQGIVLNRQDRNRLFEAITAEILGFGPIEPLLKDDSVTEIMVNGPRLVYVEQHGRLYRTDVRFRDDDHVMRVIDRIISPLGRRCDESQPYVDARLPDGSRVNAVIPPISLMGPVITIRKFSKTPLQPEDLVRFGSITQPMVDFLRACVQVRLNVIVSGGTGSGKTTLLNVLSSFIPGDERILTIEDAAELQLRQDHVIPLESRPANIEGKGRISIRDLVANALRMRPDRIVVGECRGGEALDMLQAMNTGHEGSMTTVHSNSPRDTLSRLETLVLMAGMELPLRAIREQIASAIHLIVHQERMKDGSRKITNISEVLRMEGDIITMQDLFVFEQTGIENGRVLGRLRPTGIRPSFMERFELANIHLAPSVFGYGENNWRG